MGPSGGKSVKKNKIIKKSFTSNFCLKHKKCYDKDNLPIIVMLADSARAKNVGVTVTSQR